MSKPIKPKSRLSADHRVIARILELSYGDKKPSEKKLDLCSKVFSNAGGSWYDFFEGKPHTVKLLKRVILAVDMKEKLDAKKKGRLDDE